MAIGKNKRKPKKGAKKKIVDPFLRKEWYDIRAPSIFKQNYVGKTFVNQTQGKVLASDNLKGRVFKISLADLNKDEDRFYRNIHLISEDVQGNNILTNFHGMSFTSDKIKQLVKKWQTTIETVVEVKTSDSYVLRLFCVGFTKKRPNQRKKTSYAQTSQVKQIRKKMTEIMTREAAVSDIKGLFSKFIAESIAKQIESECQGIYPLHQVYIRKAKIIKRPKFDAAVLSDVHKESATQEDVGTAVGQTTEATANQ
eukprot:TRINITY_DN115_c0_g2_i1.p1 TRINITY_DN115_c0_g2~~TRINITY_DN115_c0_g2_i1.p1  ORF type:complete len:254 (-),score=60.67 TRINITY_DN115_c0_g2_i1:39-800(-)